MEWRGKERDRGSSGGGGREEKEVKLMTRQRQATHSTNPSGTKSGNVGTKKSPSPLKHPKGSPRGNSGRPERQKPESGKSTSGGKTDQFAAALSALEKLEVAPSDNTTSTTEQLPSQTGEDKKRELSPSVAAMFDSIKEAALSSSNSTLTSSSSETAAIKKEGLSPTLKAMLKMEESGGVAGKEVEQTTDDMPSAIQKLMYNPRGPLLPRPPSTNFQQTQFPHPPPPPTSYPYHQQAMGHTPAQFGQGGDYYQSIPLHPPPHPHHHTFMPFGPPPMDPFTVLQNTCHVTGQPPPQFNCERNEKGYYLCVVRVGKRRCSGMACSTQEEAKQSAAAAMNSTMPPSPMFYPMPPHGGYSGPPPYPPHVPMVPPYVPNMPLSYHPRGPQPPPQMTPPPPHFVPLQVQRRQGQQSSKRKPSHPSHGIPQQPLPSETDKGTKLAGAQKPTTSEKTATSATSACITDDEKVRAEKQKQQQKQQQQCGGATAPEGPEDGPEDGLKGTSDIDERKKVEEEEEDKEEVMEVASSDTEIDRERKNALDLHQKLSNLKEMLSVLQDPAANMAENSQKEGGGGERKDVIAEAAIVSALELKEEEEEGMEDYVESVQASDAAVGQSEVHVVGEILGGGAGGGAGKPLQDQIVPNTTTANQTDPPDTTAEQQSIPPLYSTSTTDDVAMETTTTDQDAKDEGEIIDTISSDPSPPTTSAGDEGSSGAGVKTVGRPKRQLAASFARNTT